MEEQIGALVDAILEWWNNHRSDVCEFCENDIYDDVPEFVGLAEELAEGE